MRDWFSHQMSDKEYTLEEAKALAKMLQESCEHEFNYYIDVFSDATYIPGEAECQLCGIRFAATMEGEWTVHLDQIVENSTL